MAHREPRSISRAVARPETPVDARPDARVEPHREPRPLALVIVHRSVGAGDNGGLVFHCHAGCSQVAVLSALEWHEVEVTSTQGPSSEIGATGNIALLVERRGFKIAAQYGYEDEKGELLYQNVRLERYRNEKRQKTFRQRRPGPDGKGWIENLSDTRRVPYRLSDIARRLHEDIHVAEGEKDADTLAKLGLLSSSVATPSKVDLSVFSDRHVVIHEDNDGAGRKKARDLANRVGSTAASVRIVSCPTSAPVRQI